MVAAIVLLLGIGVGVIVHEVQQRQPLQVKMVEVPAGEFFMGCNEQIDKECSDDEKPGRQVFVGDFKIDKTEVTVAAYQRCINAKACTPPPTINSSDLVSTCYWFLDISERADYPINCVSWDQAKAFCEWEGKRLPSEGEWEKAARGTDGRIYPWGNEWDDKKANTDGKEDGFEYTAPVGSFSAGASPYGALDMAGNVWEWVGDMYDKKSYKRSARGGAWNAPPQFAGVSDRMRFLLGITENASVGIRCAQ